jgi:hypothetical protein
MKATAKVVEDPKHGETLEITYYVRRSQLKWQGLEYIVMFITKDVVRRILSLREWREDA